ncbi:MAG: preprotein translocase subunit SecY [Hyphomicrobiales bacterium]|nr:preprotein translocase subunit SecY [Hyphomicrobiales bacterium]
MAITSGKNTPQLNLGVLGRAKELKKRIWFVLGALIVYRIGTYVPLPGIDSRALNQLFSQHSGGIMDIFNMFSGGALGRMTIFALNVMPYITVSIVMQLLTVMSPALSAIKKEGERGRQKINQYTRYGTVLMASFQGMGIAVFLESSNASSGGGLVLDPGLFFRISTISTLVGGTMFLMWLGEQITARGIGNGISLIIFAGIVAGLPSALASTFELGRTGALSTVVILLIVALAIGLIFFIVFMELSQRRIVVQYPKRQMGNKMFGGESTHMPLKLNMSGVIPPIFASSLLLFPATLAGFSAGEGPAWLETLTIYLGHGKPLYIATYVLLIVFFCFFYTKNVFNPTETADNLKKNGGFVPGIRPGKHTADYIDRILTRITVIGAAYIAFVCVVPEILISQYAVPFYLGGTSLLIVVNVTMDTMTQVQSHLLAHQYEGLLKKAKLGGRRK